jgi:hypothetical protein
VPGNGDPLRDRCRRLDWPKVASLSPQELTHFRAVDDDTQIESVE